jgi:hypothetical protein
MPPDGAASAPSDVECGNASCRSSSVRETVRRREAHRMELIEQQKREQASLRTQLHRNRGLLALALIGAMLAAWQWAKRQ